MRPARVEAWVLLLAGLVATAGCKTGGATPGVLGGQCGPAVNSQFAYALRDVNRGTRGLIETRRGVADAHLLPGSVCSLESAIGALTLQNRSLHCTASLISPRVALTAAHCVHRIDVQRLRFVIGNNVESQDAPSYRVQSAVVHPGYVEGCEINDLAAIVLEEDVVDVQPLTFAAEPLSSVPDVSFTYVGYGFAQKGAIAGAGVKRCADLRVGEIGKGSFVASLGAENVCHGDSGGPALERTQQGYRIVGVTSWGDRDCRRRVASTDVGANAQFIAKASADASQLRPAQHAALGQLVVEMVDPSDENPLSAVEPFPAFPYYSDASDNDTTWPDRAWSDREEFAKKVEQYFVAHPFRDDGSIKTYSSAPEDPSDTWQKIKPIYMELRQLANFSFKGNPSGLAGRIGSSAASAFVELEKKRAYIHANMPNRLWILRVRNESLSDEGPLDLSFLIGGYFYDLRTTAIGASHSKSPSGVVNVHVPKIEPRATIELRVWYRYLPVEARAMPDLSNVEIEKTQGILIKQLVLGGVRFLPAEKLVKDEAAVAYKVYPAAL